MRMALAASLLGIVAAACATALPTPATPGQSPVVTAVPSVAATVVPATPANSPDTSTTAPSTDAPSASPQPTPEPSVATFGAWRERTDVAAGPSPREDHSWTVDADGAAAYLFGGRGDSDSNELWRFDLTSDTWAIVQPNSPGPSPRFGHTATWVPGIGLVIWSGQSGSDFFADIWAYDPSANAWRELPSLGAPPAARYGSCAALGPDGRLWISHGFTDAGRFSDTRAYDFASGQWADVTPTGRVPVERCLQDCFWSASGQFVLYGGQTTGVPALGDIWALAPDSGEWIKGPDTDAPARQLYALADVAGGALVFGGGSLERNYLNDAWRIDATTLELSQVEQIEPLPSPRAGATLITDAGRGRLLLFGGVNDGGVLADLWELPAAL
ncbi:hypothetical protein BH24CHL5_BH24CHL5_09450 [soil metagenome]